MKKIVQFILVSGCLLPASFSYSQKLIKVPVQETWSRDYEPFRIAGNLYYVGTYDLACYLVVTSKGHILINTGAAGSAAMIRKHVEQLGFRFGDIKILLATHAHYDHVGDMAAIKKITKAKMMINEKDASLLADGGNSDFIFGGKGSMFQPVHAERMLHDQDSIRLGNVGIVMLHHPGHTKGASSFLFDVKDEHHSYRILIANMPSILEETRLSGMPAYPEVGQDYAKTLTAMKNLQFDIWLAAHASQFDLHGKRKPGDVYHPEVFADRKGYDSAIKELEKQYQERLSEK